MCCAASVHSVRLSAAWTNRTLCTDALDMADLHTVMALKWLGHEWANSMSEVANLDMRRNGIALEYQLHAAGVAKAEHMCDDNSFGHWFDEDWQIRVRYGQINVVNDARHAGFVQWYTRSDFDASQIGYFPKLVQRATICRVHSEDILSRVYSNFPYVIRRHPLEEHGESLPVKRSEADGGVLGYEED